MVRFVGRGEWSAPGNRYGRRWIPPSRPTEAAPELPEELTVSASDLLTLTDTASAFRAMLAEGADAITFGDSGVADVIALLALGEDSASFSDSAMAALTAIAAAMDSASFSDSAVASMPGADPYTHYPALDKSLLPFTLAEAVAPSGMSSVTAADATELATHLAAGDRSITLTGDVVGTSTLLPIVFDFDIVNCEIIVPVGRQLMRVAFGNYGGSTGDRLRIRGSTLGDRSTCGLVHYIRFWGTWTDIILDYINLTGPGRTDDGSPWQQEFCVIVEATPTQHTNNRRFAMHGCLLAAGGYNAMLTIGDSTICGNSLQAGLEDIPLISDDGREGWGIRFTNSTVGHTVVFENDIRGDRYHHLRWHPDGTTNQAWVVGNTFVNRTEPQICWVDAAAGGGSGSLARFHFADNLCIHSDSGNDVPGNITIGPTFNGGDVAIVEIVDNLFESDVFLDDGDITMTGTTSTTKSGNDYTGVLPSADPAWLNGDPTGLTWDL